MRIACLETDQPAVAVDVRCSQPLPEARSGISDRHE